MALTPAQLNGITTARKAYRTAVRSIESTLDDALVQVKRGVNAAVAPQSRAVEDARDAYDLAREYGGDTTAVRAALDQALTAYRAALTTAQATARTQADAAKATARAALDSARATYVAAVTAQFAPGTAIANRLLTPPSVGSAVDSHSGGNGLGSGSGSQDDDDDNGDDDGDDGDDDENDDDENDDDDDDNDYDDND
ncbi:MAG: hypothetical protein ACYC2Z_08890 [Candidatus Nanopelagicales bacterium]